MKRQNYTYYNKKFMDTGALSTSPISSLDHSIWNTQSSYSELQLMRVIIQDSKF